MYAADARHPVPSLAEKLAHIYSLRGGLSIDLTLRPAYYALLERLGNPHKNLPPVIHVAGTNGKGSTIATLRAIFEAGGHTAHVYTSPHLLRFNERIVLAGQEISDALLENLLDEVMEANAGLALTFFEITTALAFLAFSRMPADVLLLETGLGGRLDSTNVIETPAVTIIAGIGRDHAEYLGESLAEIAFEKAGIMKPSVPCVIGPQEDASVLAVFEQRARELDCPLYRCGTEWGVAVEGNAMNIILGAHTLALPLPSLAGPHQPGNAASAIAAVLAADLFTFSRDEFARGLRQIVWPGRLQQLQPPCLPQGWELWVDGGHNDHAARALGRQARAWQVQDGKPLHLVLGMMKTKDPAAFVAPLKEYAGSVTAVPVAGEDLAHDSAALAAALGGAQQAASLEHAVRTLLRSGPEGRILISGSLYLAGQALSLWGS